MPCNPPYDARRELIAIWREQETELRKTDLEAAHQIALFADSAERGDMNLRLRGYQELPTCDECTHFAEWSYGPSGDNRRYCDEHVPRHECSCNYDEQAGDYVRDERGRHLPCADWVWIDA